MLCETAASALMREDRTTEWLRRDAPLPYPEGVDYMEAKAAAIHAGSDAEQVWLVEHPPLYTAGTSAKEKDLLIGDEFPVYKSGRGGQYTYHGPGQRTVYVMMDLAERGRDIRCFVSGLEAWVINTLADFGLKGERRDGRIGIWITHPDSHGRMTESKIAAVGVRVRKWVTFHGIAINLNPDLSHFDGIVPCGIKEFGVTSFEALGLDITMDQLDAALKDNFEKLFGPTTSVKP